MKSKISILAIVFSALLLGSFLQMGVFSDPFLTPKLFFFAFSASFIVIGFSVFLFTKSQALKYTITLIDLGLATFFIYLSFSYIINSSNPFLQVKWINLLLLIIIYALSKPLFSKGHSLNRNNRFVRTVIVSLLLVGIGQALFGAGQYFGIIANKYTRFKIAGAFGNSGSYANYLVALFPFGLALAVYVKNSLLKYLAVLGSFVMLFTLSLTAARTAWISAFVTITYILFHSKYVSVFWKTYFADRIRKSVFFALVFLLLASAAFALVSFKKDSASGRVFIWKVSIEMIKDKPLFGHGFTSYSVVHNNYQANYFRAHPDDKKNSFLADSVSNAFNEFIQIAAELGIIGLFIFLIIPIGVFRYIDFKKEKAPDLMAAEASILAIMTASLFSYPLQNLPVQIVLCISLLVVSSNRKSFSFSAKSVYTRVFAVVFLILSVAFLKLEYKRLNAELKWTQAFKLVRKSFYRTAQRDYAEIYPVMQYNQFFLFNYGAELSIMEEPEKSIAVLSEIKNRLNTEDYYIYLGNSYEAVKDYSRALECFEQASMIMPIKYYPRYRMFVIYYNSGDMEKAEQTAQEIIDLPVKVNSETVEGIRGEMQEFLLSNTLK